MNDESSYQTPESEVQEVDGNTTADPQLIEAQQKAAEYYDQLLRLKAEFENFRKRTEREKVESRQWGKQEVIMPLLGLVDTFEQAIQQVQHATDLKNVVQGMNFLYKSFADFLKAQGLQPLDVVGKKFDPHLAEAVEQVEVEKDQAGIVLSEVQRGYSFQGKILRPSSVRVGVAKEELAPKDDLSADEG